MDAQLAVTIILSTLMLSLGVSESFQQLISLWRQPAVLLRALFAVIVLVPITVIVLLWIFDLPPAIATGLALLAAAPGAPMTTKRAEIAAADLPYASSLQLTLGLLAVIITPVTLAVFYSLFELTIESVSPIDVASQVIQVTFVPVIIGQLLLHFAPKFTALIRKPLTVLANVLLVLLVLGAIALLWVTPELRAGLNLGWQASVAIVIMVIGALVIGHIIGGPRMAQRGALATASVARNFGLALFIAGLTENGAASVMTLVVYLLVGVAIATPYALWIRRQVVASKEGE
jgi:BASS family bile acid:Na+ symporter